MKWHTVAMSRSTYELLKNLSQSKNQSMSKTLKDLVNRSDTTSLLQMLDDGFERDRAIKSISVDEECYSKIYTIRAELNRVVARKYRVIRKLRKVKNRKRLSIRDVVDLIILSHFSDSP